MKAAALPASGTGFTHAIIWLSGEEAAQPKRWGGASSSPAQVVLAWLPPSFPPRGGWGSGEAGPRGPSSSRSFASSPSERRRSSGFWRPASFHFRRWDNILSAVRKRRFRLAGRNDHCLVRTSRAFGLRRRGGGQTLRLWEM